LKVQLLFAACIRFFSLLCWWCTGSWYLFVSIESENIFMPSYILLLTILCKLLCVCDPVCVFASCKYSALLHYRFGCFRHLCDCWHCCDIILLTVWNII